MKNLAFKKSYIKHFIMLMIAAVLLSCNDKFPNLLDQYGEAETATPLKDKVLMIVVDGLNGSTVREVQPPKLRVLARTALVSYNGLTDPAVDFQATVETGWANLLTGVENGKNGVKSADLSKVNTQVYPTIFARLKNQEQTRSSTFYTSTPALKQYLGNDAQVIEAADDQQLLQKFEQDILKEESDMLVLQLSNPEKVGQIHGYSVEDAEYVQALSLLDDQIDGLIKVLGNRKNYANENWMVIVTSSKGGQDGKARADYTAFGDAERNTFTMLYSPKFVGKVVASPRLNQLAFTGNALRVARINDNDRITGVLSATHSANYNMGTDKSFTMTLFVKHTSASTKYSYPSFFSKRSGAFGGGGNGFNFFLEEGYWGFNHSGGGNQVLGNMINDGKWHSIVAVVDRVKGTVTAYTDGEAKSVSSSAWSGTGQLTAGSSYNSDAPLRVGYFAGDNSNMDISVANIQIYNRAFTAAEVKKYAGITSVTAANHPYYSNLIGYWPGYKDAGTSILKSGLQNGYHFALSGGTVRWQPFNEVVEHFQPEATAEFFRLVPNGVDMSFVICQWFGIPIDKNWGLDGKSWSIDYKKVRE